MLPPCAAHIAPAFEPSRKAAQSKAARPPAVKSCRDLVAGALSAIKVPMDMSGPQLTKTSLSRRGLSSLWVIGSLVGSAAVIGLVALPMFRNGDS